EDTKPPLQVDRPPGGHALRIVEQRGPQKPRTVAVLDGDGQDVPPRRQVHAASHERLAIEPAGRSPGRVEVDAHRPGRARVAPAQDYAAAAGRHLAATVLLEDQVRRSLAEAIQRVDLLLGHGPSLPAGASLIPDTDSEVRARGGRRDQPSRSLTAT